MTKGRFINLASVTMDIHNNVVNVEHNGVYASKFFRTDEDAWNFYDQPHLPEFQELWDDLYDEWLKNCEELGEPVD